MMLKRQKRDVIIWIVHELYFTSMSTPTISFYQPGIDLLQQLTLGISMTLLLLPSKLIPVYLGVAPFVKTTVNDSTSKYYVLIRLFLSIILGIIAYRIAMYVVVYPFIFNIPVEFALGTEIQRWMSNFSEIIVPMLLFGSIWTFDAQFTASEKARQLENEKLEIELQFLKNQTNPHFLFNTLNTIYGLIRKNQKAAETSILEVSELLRYLLYECNVKEVPLETEQIMMEKFIQLQNLRFGNRTPAIANWCKPESSFNISPGLLLPLIDNAYKFSHFDKEQKSKISIETRLNKDRIYHFRISNPYRENTTSGSGGIGLTNLKRQLEIEYPERHTFEIEKNGMTFIVDLKIDLKNSANKVLPNRE